MANEQRTYYELTPSQEVSELQCKYTLFKRVVNILTSATTDKQLDFDILEKAFNLAVQRNDCARINFVKKKGKILQYIKEEVIFNNIPRYEFKTKEEQDAFINKQTKHAIKYMKGEVISPTFIKTYDNRCMVFLKVSHFNFDVYGLNLFTNDLFSIYDALVNGTELPAEPKKYEDLIKKDLIVKHDQTKIESHREYFKNQFSSNPEPYYAGLDGLTNKYMIKDRAKGKRMARMFFIRNKTKVYPHQINKELVDKMVKLATEKGTTIANMLLYIYSVTQSRMNGDTPFLLPLELCNMRDTLLARKCAGTKVQSLNVLTKVDKDQTFSQNLDFFVKEQLENYRHIGMSDMEHQVLLHKIYKTSIMTTYYALSFSFIPYEKPEGVEINFYSNGRCALPCYAAVMYDVKSGEIGVGYDCQIKLLTEENVKNFHENLIEVIDQVTSNPDILVGDIKVK